MALKNSPLPTDKINIVHHTPSESLKTYLGVQRGNLCLHAFVVSYSPSRTGGELIL